jgi:uncharacterized LabA/DUF88 family protein
MTSQLGVITPPLPRVSFFIDGFNLYHAIDEKSGFSHYKWMNYKSLTASFLKTTEAMGEVFYFTSIATWNPTKMIKHRTFISAQKHHGVKVILGRFKSKQRKCLAQCGKSFTLPEEKQTDVNIAINLLQGAYLNSYDTAIIVSGDSDLIPAINAVKSVFPMKKIGVVIPIGRMAEDIKKACDFSFQMREEHLKDNRLDEVIVVGPSVTIECPKNWRLAIPSVAKNESRKA